MKGAVVVSDQVFQSLIDLDETVSTEVAARVALATLVGACRAFCQLHQGSLLEAEIRTRVLANLRDASPLCHEIFGAQH